MIVKPTKEGSFGLKVVNAENTAVKPVVNGKYGNVSSDSMPSFEDASYLGMVLRWDGNSEIHQFVDFSMVPYVGDPAVVSYVQDTAALVPFKESTNVDDGPWTLVTSKRSWR